MNNLYKNFDDYINITYKGTPLSIRLTPKVDSILYEKILFPTRTSDLFFAILPEGIFANICTKSIMYFHTINEKPPTTQKSY